MAKRYTATEIWSEDWFLEMPNEYKLFWYFMLSACDHSGLFRVNLKSFCSLNEVKINSDTALNYFNKGKNRLRVINHSLWLIEDFFVYQYGQTFNENNRVHASILELYKKNEIKLTSIRGLKEFKDRVKDKDIDIVLIEIEESENFSEKIKADIKMVVAEMYKIWQTKNPMYPMDKERDYSSLLQFAYRIAESKGWKKSTVISSKELDVLKSWEKITDYILQDSWLKNKPLSTILTQWQGIVMGMTETKTEKTKPKYHFI